MELDKNDTFELGDVNDACERLQAAALVQLADSRNGVQSKSGKSRRITLQARLHPCWPAHYCLCACLPVHPLLLAVIFRHFRTRPAAKVYVPKVENNAPCPLASPAFPPFLPEPRCRRRS
jgi:hypothetical protein